MAWMSISSSDFYFWVSRLLSTGKKNIFLVSTVFFAISAGHEVLSRGSTRNVISPKWDPTVGSGVEFFPTKFSLIGRFPRATTVSKSMTSCSSIGCCETIITNFIRGVWCVISSNRIALLLNHSRHPAWSPNTILFCHENTLEILIKFSQILYEYNFDWKLCELMSQNFVKIPNATKSGAKGTVWKNKNKM